MTLHHVKAGSVVARQGDQVKQRTWTSDRQPLLLQFLRVSGCGFAGMDLEARSS